MYELFGQKFKECEKSLLLVAMGYLRNTEDARECVQEAAYSALKAYGRLKNAEYFKTWLTRIVINKCKDCLKRKRRAEELEDALDVFCDMPNEEMELMDCILRLEPKLSVYITLRFYDDLTYSEVAHVLRQPVSTVKYKTRKALLALKKQMEGDSFDENDRA